MPEPLLTFQTFNDAGLAAAIAEQLTSQGVEARVVDESPEKAPVYGGGDSLEAAIHLRIRAADFDKATALLEAYYQTQLQHIDPDYYLLHFSDQELLDVLAQPDQWGHLDYALAQQLLKERGHTLTPEMTTRLKEQRLQELQKPEKPPPFWIIAGYIAAFAGGIFGIGLGNMLAFLKKPLPNGQKAFIYSPSERKHGKWILAISLVSFIFWLTLLIRHLG